MKLNLLIACVALIHWVSPTKARAALRWLVLRDLRGKFDGTVDAKLLTVLRNVYSSDGSCQIASLQADSGVIRATTTYCHFVTVCDRYGVPDLVRVICEADREYWTNRLGGRFEKVTRFENGATTCLAVFDTRTAGER